MKNQQQKLEKLELEGEQGTPGNSLELPLLHQDRIGEQKYRDSVHRTQRERGGTLPCILVFMMHPVTSRICINSILKVCKSIHVNNLGIAFWGLKKKKLGFCNRDPR